MSAWPNSLGWSDEVERRIESLESQLETLRSHHDRHPAFNPYVDLRHPQEASDDFDKALRRAFPEAYDAIHDPPLFGYPLGCPFPYGVKFKGDPSCTDASVELAWNPGNIGGGTVSGWMWVS